MSDSRLYSAYYEDGRVSVWREVCAVDKAANILSLWRIVGGRTAQDVAEIGCGDGALLRELDKGDFGRAYTGFEISKSGIEIARRTSYRRPNTFVLFDGEHVPVSDKSFDLVILSHVLEHVECPRTLLQEAARIAQFVFVEVPLEMTMRTPYNFKSTEVGHINLFNPLLIRHLAQSVGLQVMAEKVTCPGLRTFTFGRSKWKGVLHWAIKVSFLKSFPNLASKCFSYHASLLLRHDKTYPADMGREYE